MRSVGWCVMAALSLGSAGARAAVNVDAQEVRRYALPAGMDARQADIRPAGDGGVLLAATTGEADQSRCRVVVVTADQATSYVYAYQGQATTCVGVEAGPAGSFFIRGDNPEAADNAVAGFSARIGADGSELWAIGDQQLVDAQGPGDGGTGEFVGAYAAAHPAMAYSSQLDSLVAFTTGTLNVDDGLAVTQAHVVAADTGRLTTSGQAVGLGSNGGDVADVLVDPTNGHFLIQVDVSSADGASFFDYDGRGRVDQVDPAGQSWRDRHVVELGAGVSSRIYIVWTAPDEPAISAHVNAVGADFGELWSSTVAAQTDIVGADNPAALGAPVGVGVGRDYLMITYRVSGRLVAAIVDAADGQALGMVDLSAAANYEPVALTAGAGGAVKLLATESGTLADTIHEYRLSVEADAAGPAGDAGLSDAGLSDAGLSDAGLRDAGLSDAANGSDASDGDPGCTSLGPGAPLSGPSATWIGGLLVAIGVWLRSVYHRRRCDGRRDV